MAIAILLTCEKKKTQRKKNNSKLNYPQLDQMYLRLFGQSGNRETAVKEALIERQ